jgi:hypothetical protein
MLFYISLGLIATLTSFSGDYDDRTQEVKDFEWEKIRISVLTRFQ